VRIENAHKLFSDEVGNATVPRNIYDIDSDIPANHVSRCGTVMPGQRHFVPYYYCEMRNLSSNAGVTF